MKRKDFLIGLTGCLLLMLWATTDQSSSQTQKPQGIMDFESRMNEQRATFKERAQKNKKIMEQYSDQAYQEAIGADENQWKTIKPRLERVKKLRNSPSISISVYGGGASSGGGSGGSSGTYSSGGGYGGFGGSSGYGGYSGVGPAVGGAGSHQGTDRPVKAQVGDMNMGWTWQRPSSVKTNDLLTEGEDACEKLLDVLETNNPDHEQINQKVTILRKIREQNRHELLQAQQQLREVVTLGQEAKLILMGYLD
jgi:hypothetical protein